MGFMDRLKGLVGPVAPEAEENPTRALDRVLRDLKRSMGQGRGRVASAIHEEKNLRREAKRARKQAAVALEKARRALAGGDEAGAKRMLARKKRADKIAAELTEELVRHRQAIEKLKDGLAQLSDRLQALEARRARLRARQRRTRALEARNQALGGDGLGEAEALLEEALTHAEVEEELLGLAGAGDEVDQRFEALEGSGELDLLMLAELGPPDDDELGDDDEDEEDVG